LLKKLLLSHLILLLSFLSVYGQEELLYLPLDVEFKGVKLDSALNILEIETGIYFTYDVSNVEIDREIRANFIYTPLSIILDSILRNPFLDYTLIDKQLIIHKNQTNESIDNDSSSLILEQPIIILKGQVFEADTKIILPYVNIGVKNKSIGTISNENGYFILKLPSSLESDTIIFSFIGFKSKFIPIRNFEIDTIIELESKIIPLQEVVIRSSDPKSLVSYAIKSKKDNYSSNASILRCFYREIMTRNNKYKLYTEGLIDIYKSPYRPTLFNDQIKLLKKRTFSNVISEDTVQFKLQGGLKSSLDLDLIKHPLNFLQISTLNLYKYKLTDIVSYNGRLLYQIGFSPIIDGKIPVFKGNIFIDVRNLAIVKVQFNYTNKTLRKLKNAFILRKSRRIKVNITEANYELSYKNLNGKYYVNRIYGKLKLKVKNRNKFLASIFETSFELVTTDIQLENIERFKRKESLKQNKIFSEMNTNYNSKFWSKDNFIFPEKDLSKALGRFKVEELKINGNY